MNYKFNVKKENYALFASGSVLYSLPGQPAFPIRLAGEIYQRCAEILDNNNINPQYSIYDPFCGSGYLITSLGFLYKNRISTLFASDISNTAVELARRNLNLLTDTGLNTREQELSNLYRTFRKESHLEALEKIKQIRTEFLNLQPKKTVTKVFQANALSEESLRINAPAASIDIVITDVPYGNQTNWLKNESSNPKTEPIMEFLEAIRHFVKPAGLIALTAHDKIKFSQNPNYVKADYFKVGHRHTYIIQIL